ncbi:MULTISPECIES: hypothetical protein [Cupriavidus]|nr:MULTISPECIES: hypothetical protein [Cupriavidus]
MNYFARSLLAACAVLVLAGGCASPAGDGSGSGITTYGTVDIGISSERSK